MKSNLSQLFCNAGQKQPRIGSEVPSDLTGKQIHHRWIVESESECFSGTVLGKVAGQESDSGMWYNLHVVKAWA